MMQFRQFGLTLRSARIARALALVLGSLGLGACNMGSSGPFCEELVFLGLGETCDGSPLAAEPNEASSTRAVTGAAGDVLLAGGVSRFSTQTAELFKPSTQTFVATGMPTDARAGATAVAFPGGALPHHVLIASGGNSGASLDLAAGSLSFPTLPLINGDTYNPATGTFAATGSVTTTRTMYTATRLNNGKALLAGGFTDQNGTVTNTAELYDPATNHFTAITSHLHKPRALHTATLLADDTVLLVGGLTDANGTVANTAEIYHPNSNTFTAVPSLMPVRMAGHTATLISGCNCSADGKVLLTGGFHGIGNATSGAAERSQNAAVIYDPATKTFSAVGISAMHDQRVFHTATLLSGGKVLLAGGMAGSATYKNGVIFGNTRSDFVTHRSAEIFNPKQGTMTCVGGLNGAKCVNSMHNVRVGHIAARFLAGPLHGKVLIAGGSGTRNAELYNPASNTFTLLAAKMRSPRTFAASALIP